MQSPKEITKLNYQRLIKATFDNHFHSKDCFYAQIELSTLSVKDIITSYLSQHKSNCKISDFEYICTFDHFNKVKLTLSPVKSLQDMDDTSSAPTMLPLPAGAVMPEDAINKDRLIKSAIRSAEFYSTLELTPKDVENMISLYLLDVYYGSNQETSPEVEIQEITPVFESNNFLRFFRKLKLAKFSIKIKLYAD